MISVCPGGQVLLTCERISGSILYWTTSAPHLAISPKRIVLSQGTIASPEFNIGFTEFHITRTSQSPLISQLLINNVTAGINGSNIYCSEDDNEINAPMNWIHNNIIILCSIDDALRSADYPLNISLVNHLLRNNDITVILQWPREPGVVYHVNVLPDTPFTKAMSYNTVTINLAISYNVQYNVSIVSSLCGVTTNKVLHYADCGVPHVDKNVKLNYSSTLDGSILLLTCENEMSNTTDEQVLNVICHSNGNWIPNPAEFTCSSFTTVPPDGPDQDVILSSVLGALIIGATAIITTISAIILCLTKKGFLHLKGVNRLPDIRSENTHHTYHQPCAENSTKQPNQQDTLVYADIGPSSYKKRVKHVVTLSPDDTDDRVEYALLNHSLQKPVVETNQDSVADDTLNLDTLLIQLRGAVTSRWYQLGEALEVNKDVLDKCSNYPPEDSIIEILDQWLRNFPGHPTWRDVASALRKINLQQLANDIEMVYETGKLPIQVDDDDAQQVFTTTVLELPQPEEEKTRTPNLNNHHDQDESAPPLPPKPLAGSDMPKKISAPPRPPKYVAKS